MKLPKSDLSTHMVLANRDRYHCSSPISGYNISTSSSIKRHPVPSNQPSLIELDLQNNQNPFPSQFQISQFLFVSNPSCFSKHRINLDTAFVDTMVLISGLPDEVVYDCLIRVKYDQFPTITSVSKSWKSEVELPEFHRLRKKGGYGQKLIVMVQARVAPNQGAIAGAFKCLQNPLYRFTVCEPDSGDWRDFAPISVFPGGSLPMFCQFAAVGTDLVVLGGLDPVTWASSKSVFVYNFMTATWRRGTDMPGGPRIFFGCTSDSDRMVFVAGGHDDQKIALRSAMTYDVAKDEWIMLPDMERERDECKAVFQHGKLRVIGGYCTEMQGRFERSAETFDTSTWQWNCVHEDFLQNSVCPRTCVVGSDGSVYMCRDGGHVIKQTSGKWQIVAVLPIELRNPASLTMWHGNLLVIGCAAFGEPHMAYVFNLENNIWSKVETPEKYSGHVQSSCYLEI